MSGLDHSTDNKITPKKERSAILKAVGQRLAALSIVIDGPQEPIQETYWVRRLTTDNELIDVPETYMVAHPGPKREYNDKNLQTLFEEFEKLDKKWDVDNEMDPDYHEDLSFGRLTSLINAFLSPDFTSPPEKKLEYLSYARKLLALFSKVSHYFSAAELDVFFYSTYDKILSPGYMTGSVGLGKCLVAGSEDETKEEKQRYTKNEIRNAISNPKKFFKKNGFVHFIEPLKALEKTAERFSDEKNEPILSTYRHAALEIESRLYVPFQAALLDDYFERALEASDNKPAYSTWELLQLCNYIDFRYFQRVLFELKAYYVSEYDNEELNKPLSKNTLKYKQAIQQLLPFVYREQWFRLCKRVIYTISTLGIALAINWTKWQAEWNMRLVKIDLYQPNLSHDAPSPQETKEPFVSTSHSPSTQSKEKLGLFNPHGELRKIEASDKHTYVTKPQAERVVLRKSGLSATSALFQDGQKSKLQISKEDSRILQSLRIIVPADDKSERSNCLEDSEPIKQTNRS